MTDREERQHVIEVLKQMRLDYEDFWEENDTEEIKAFNYAIASIETDLKYDLLYEETSGQADKNDLGVSSGLDKNSKKLEKDFCESDCISREQAKAAIRDKFKDLPSRVEINTILNELPQVTPQEPKIGHKVSGDLFGGLYCSECMTYVNEYFNYCPHCGAKMVDLQESEG